MNPIEVIPLYPSAELEKALDLATWGGAPMQAVVVPPAGAGESDSSGVMFAVAGLTVVGGIGVWALSRRKRRRSR